jgi:hypothetical protein
MSIYFLTEFFKYFFRLLHEAGNSWLNLFRVFRLHPVLASSLDLEFLGKNIPNVSVTKNTKKLMIILRVKKNIL